MHPTLKRTAAALALTTALGAPGMLAAQQNQTAVDDPDPNVTVQERPRPDYDPLGIRAGSFLIYPSLTVSGQYDSNAFTTKDNEESDVALITSPQIEINSNWNRHALNFAVGATGAAKREYSENDYLDAFAEASGRLDVTARRHPHGHARASTGRTRTATIRDESGTTTIDTSDDNRGNLVRYYSGLVDGQYRHNFARFFTVAGRRGQAAGIREHRRPRVRVAATACEYGGRARLGYQLSPRIGPFVQGNDS